jgi:crotonobetainyl-CoA:carnitine CoA-transferase CaiB-like acyl-CoA transferase
MGVLNGIKVIEMGHVVAAPAAAAMLADWGAEVYKIEPPYGEMFRSYKRNLGAEITVKYDNGDVNWVVQLLNRNKKGVSVDLKTDAGKEIVYKLVQKVDIFLSNYELSALNKLKMDYDTLHEKNPALIYSVLTGYGTKGPDKDERGFDYTAAWARAGTQFMVSTSDDPRPPRPGFMDRVVGTNMVAGILGALLYRIKTGKGQKIEISLYQSGIWCMATDIQGALVGHPLGKHIRTKSANPLWNTYRTKDNVWLQLVMLQSDLHWPGFCKAIDRPDLTKDPRYCDMNVREQNSEELITLLDKIFITKDATEWKKRFKKHGCIYGQVSTPEEVINDPQAFANDFFPSVNHPAMEGLRLVSTPVNFSLEPSTIRTPAPEIGEHTEEILLELDYSWDDIAELKDKQVIL